MGEGLWEIACRAWHDPATHSASKVSWGVPVDNAHVESHFTVPKSPPSLSPLINLRAELTSKNKEYLPSIREALARVPAGGWREFAAFAGPELSQLTAWGGRVVLVGDSSHALSGAFGSGAGFAMEDGWVLARALARVRGGGGEAPDASSSSQTPLAAAAALFDGLRVPYYARMYAHLADQAEQRARRLRELAGGADGGQPSWDQRVANKIISDGGRDMSWIYENNIGEVWKERIALLGAQA